MKILKRTFEASNYPKGSDERIRLNKSNITSEYMISEKYLLFYHMLKFDGSKFEVNFGFRTKKEAQKYFDNEKEKARLKLIENISDVE